MSVSNFFILATTYGSGTYNSCNYNGTNCGGTVIPTPFGNLPVTGPLIWTLVGILLAAIAVGLYVWARQRRQRRRELAAATGAAPAAAVTPAVPSKAKPVINQ